jgi:hypothetical protein
MTNNSNNEFLDRAERLRAGAALHHVQLGPELCPSPAPPHSCRPTKQAHTFTPCAQEDWSADGQASIKKA